MNRADAAAMTLADMSPRAVANNALDSGSVNPEFLSQGALGDRPAKPTPANLPDFIVGQFGLMVIDSQRHSHLASRVGHVFSVCPEEEVKRIDARGIITAGAVMTDLHPVRDRVVVQLPRDATGFDVSPFDTERAVSIAVRRTDPQPAFVCLVNARPECHINRRALSLGLGVRTRLAAKTPSTDSKARLVNHHRLVAMFAKGGNSRRTLSARGTLGMHLGAPIAEVFPSVGWNPTEGFRSPNYTTEPNYDA